MRIFCSDKANDLPKARVDENNLKYSLLVVIKM